MRAGRVGRYLLCKNRFRDQHHPQGDEQHPLASHGGVRNSSPDTDAVATKFCC